MHPRGRSGKARALRTLGALLWAQAVAAAVAPGGVPPPLEIHVVPHSHCDAGYKKTFDGYLGAEVSSILSSVTQALDADPKRKFIWSESSFLEGWLRGGAGEGEAEVFRGLVTAGQVEIVGGGWIMHDEAITTHAAQLRQMQVGHVEVLKRFFGDTFRVKHGWQIDPFGQSAFTPSLMALAGMESWVTNRVGDSRKEDMKKTKSLQFVWHGNSELSPFDSEVLTHVLDAHYKCPPGLDWEKNPDPSQDPAPPVTNANVQAMSDAYVQAALERSMHYQGKSVLVPFGQDFRFQNASLQFDNMDAIVSFVNRNKKRYIEKYGRDVSIRYSTLADYFDGLYDENLTFPRREEGSLLPLVNDGHRAWTGFYSGYPNLKRLSGEVEQLVNTADVMHALSLFNSQELGREVTAWMAWSRRQASIMQHHDALPGTGYPFNNADYIYRLKESRRLAYNVLSEAVAAGGRLRGPWPGPVGVSETVVTEIISVNSLLQRRHELVRVVVTRPDVIVKGEDGAPIASQVTKLETEEGAYELQWTAAVPALGFSAQELATCTVSKWTDPPYPKPPEGCASASSIVKGVPGMEISNSRYRVALEDGLAVTLASAGVDGAGAFKASVSFAEYVSAEDTVYVFQGLEGRRSAAAEVDSAEVRTGPITSSVTVSYSNSVELVATIATAPQDLDDLFDLKISVPPLKHGTNFVVVLNTDVQSRGSSSFVNGYQREQWENDPERPVGENYRPLVGLATLEDGQTRLSVMSRSPLGFASGKPGEMEVMLHRRADGPASGNVVRGDDPSRATQELFLHAAPSGTAGARRARLLSRKLSEKIQLLQEPQSPALQSFPPVEPGPLDFRFPYGSFSAVELPEEVSLLSLRFAPGPSLHLQLEHILGKLEGGREVQLPVEGILRPSAAFRWKAQEMSATFMTTAATARGRRMWDTQAERHAGRGLPSPCLSESDGVQIVSLSPKRICSLRLIPQPS